MLVATPHLEPTGLLVAAIGLETVIQLLSNAQATSVAITFIVAFIGNN
jgi:hypothetical protein